jgi:membrane-associated PAP2 superfamily phosphatase
VSERTRVALLWALAAGQLLLGLWLALAPGAFHAALADFGPRNDHDLRDMAALYLALAAVLAVAARRPSWRVPVLALAALQYALHTVNHLVDIGRADPAWVGPFDAVTLGATAAAFAWLALDARDPHPTHDPHAARRGRASVAGRG